MPENGAKREDRTKIQWAAYTWNPWIGCTKVSTECDNCYMFAAMRRHGKDPETVVRTKPPTFLKPLKLNRRTDHGPAAPGWDGRPLVFTCSWGDWFHRDADPWRDEAWALIKQCDKLEFQVLTKRHGRIAANLPDDWGAGYENVWLGVSGGTSDEAIRRVSALAAVPAARRFLSCEPQLGPIDWDAVLSIKDATGAPALDQVIVGGESGPGARAFHLKWAFDAVSACRRYGVACFIKQIGSDSYDSSPLDDADMIPFPTRDRKGGDMAEWPVEIRVRQWPGGGSWGAP